MEHEFEYEESVPQETEEPVEQPDITEQEAELPRFDPQAGDSASFEVPTEPKVAKPAKKARKGISGGALIVISLCVSLIGGLLGGCLMAWIGQKGKEPSGDRPGTNISNVFEGDREKTEIQIHPIETGKLLTPAEVYAANVNSTVGITTQVTTNFWGYQTTSAASGSGFVYSDDGYILTNYHVIEDATSVSVSTYDGRSLDAKVVGYDESNDIAVLKVEADNLVPVVIGDSSYVNVGDPVVAIGNPLGELTFSLTSGAVSALEREVTFSGGITMSLIQTDCAINSGNSGGALFNLYGEVVGITNAKYSGSSGSGASIDNIGFAIPMNRVRTIVDSIIENGYVIKPYIGVTIIDVSEETQSYGLPQGAAIRSVEPGGPAENSGLQINDIVTHVNGEVVTGAADFKRYVTDSAPGDVLSLTIFRKGTTVELELTIGSQIQTSASQQMNQQTTEPSQSQFPFFGWND